MNNIELEPEAESEENIFNHEANKTEVNKLIDIEVDCIKSGNGLTPQEKVLALNVLENFRKRIN